MPPSSSRSPSAHVSAVAGMSGDHRVPSVSTPARRLVRHYVEMVLAMFLGMAILGVPAGWALSASGSSWSALNDDAPALMFLGMATTMTVPMVAWMRYRGHGWRANTEMSASMFLPTFAVIAMLATGVLTDIGALLIVEHAAMLLAMLIVMLLRQEEYTCNMRAHADADGSMEVAA